MRSWLMGLKVERLEFDSFSYVWSLGELCDWLRGVLCGHFCLSVSPSFLRLVLRVDRSQVLCDNLFAPRTCNPGPQIVSCASFLSKTVIARMPTTPVYYIRNR